MSDFGVVVCCCKFDYFLAKGCCAAVRHFLGNVPLTLFIDDEFNASALAKAYDVRLMYRREVKDEFLRTFNRGWGLPKLTLFWESPYERYLYLDCDTIIWGDVVKAHAGNLDWDMVVDEGDAQSRSWIPGVGTEAWVNKEYFSTSIMEKTQPDFPWRKYAGSVFCTGTYFGRRGAFDLDEYKRVVRLRSDNPGLFPIGEMGMLNYMIWNCAEKGRLNVQRRPMELMCDYTNAGSLPQKLKFDGNGPIVQATDIKVLHFTDPKPLTRSYGFHTPMTYFRKKAAQKMKGLPATMARVYLNVEELPWHVRNTYRRKYAHHHRWIGPLFSWRRKRK